jgi:phosphoglucomutase
MIDKKLNQAKKDKLILDSTFNNVCEFLELKPMPTWVIESLEELVNSENWQEINDRFHTHLAFGTGGMRGRTIGKTVTTAERGGTNEDEAPKFAAVGSNTLNELTLLRATKALYQYLESWLAIEDELEQPRLVIAHDVRHFSAKFSSIVAGAWKQLGGYAMVFDGPRSTPQLSFTIRNRLAHAGVVITASHNPYHDNGFKAYFSDGAQLVFPHDRGVVSLYNELCFNEITPWLEKDDLPKPVTLPTSDDMAYKGALEDAVLNPELLKSNPPKIVFTPIHGTGAISSVPALWDHGVNVALVDEQGIQDPNFSTVSSPNPENPEALALAIKVAKKTKSDFVMGSDPDCDRIGLAVRDSKGQFQCLSGNQVASMLSEYRLSALRAKQVIRDGNESSFVLLKTFVTSPIISKIAENYGVGCINTPTGFKWMAEKMGIYEQTARLRAKEEEGIAVDFDETELFARMDILSRYSKCVVLAAEESYGYLPFDLVRDKDGNASALAISEMLAHLISLGTSPLEFLDTLYQKYGFHMEKTENIYFEGAEGSAIINKLVSSYRENPLKEVAGAKVTRVKDYNEDGFMDEDGVELPQLNFIELTLDNAFSIAIRPSGTEPKIKYYLFGCESSNPTNLEESKKNVGVKMDEISSFLVQDAHARTAK